MSTELQQESQDRSDALRDAMHQGFNEDATPPAPARPAAAEGDKPPAAQEPAPAPAPDEPQPAEDPFAALPEAVRTALARIPTLDHELRSAVGRFGALQRQSEADRRELAELRSRLPAVQETAAPAAPRSPKMAAVRAELPEVADAMEEAVSELRDALKPKPEAQAPATASPVEPQADAPSPDAVLLDQHRPTWRQDFTNTAYRLWLGQQPEAYQREVMGTDKAMVVQASLQQFDQYKTRLAQAGAQVGERRAQRADAAVQPSGVGGGRPPPGTPNQSYADLVRAGFENP